VETSVKIAVERLKGALRPEDVLPALRAAIRLTTRAYLARGARRIGETINLKIGTIKEQFRNRIADDQTGAQAVITTLRKGVPLYEYLNSSQAFRGLGRRKNGRGPNGGIKVKVRKGAAMEIHPHAFAAVMKSSHVGIFHRGEKSRAIIGSKRLPIFEEHGPTAVGVFANAPDREYEGSIFDATCADAAVILIKNIDQQTTRFLAKYATQ
jgi:hypothetical protein